MGAWLAGTAAWPLTLPYVALRTLTPTLKPHPDTCYSLTPTLPYVALLTLTPTLQPHANTFYSLALTLPYVALLTLAPSYCLTLTPATASP